MAAEHAFLSRAGRTLNAGQSRVLVLTGNIHDLLRYSGGNEVEYLPLVDLLTASWSLPGRIPVIYELNGPIRFRRAADRERVRDAWIHWRTGLDVDALAVRNMLATSRARAELEAMSQAFDENLQAAMKKPTVALELLRQICLCSRTARDGSPLLQDDLIILIEAADMLIPAGEISHLSDADRRRVSICQDWFADPGFMAGGDAVVLLTESRSQLNARMSMLPQVVEVAVPSPDMRQREAFIEWFAGRCGGGLPLWGSHADLARATAGLSLHALRQLLAGSQHLGQRLEPAAVVDKVEAYIQSQLGGDIVEFKKPDHSLDDVVGFAALKAFLRRELIPRFQATGPDALPGAAVGGPIGSGKTFIFEAVARELDMVVLVLKNIRSQWFGQTDVIFERLRRVLEALDKVVIFVDEADTQFGGVGPEAHATERRLTGKIQAMMSDPRLRGRVIWLLMTARIHLLSPDIRRPGRVGDLIIPVLDPAGADQRDFAAWTLAVAFESPPAGEALAPFLPAFAGYSAAAFASLRSELKAARHRCGRPLSVEEVEAVLQDRLLPAIEQTRRYQTLQALCNCTRRSLLPDPELGAEERARWEAEIRHLEAHGVR